MADRDRAKGKGVENMFTKLTRRLSSVSPRVAIAGILIAIVAATGIALLLMRGEPKVDADTVVEPRAARIDRVDGSAVIARIEDDEEPDWTEATLNTPVSIGDRIYARDDSRASIALTGRNFVELKPEGSLDVLSLEDSKTQLALRSGAALFDVGSLHEGELFEVATPCGAVDFIQPGLYQIGIDGDNTVISVLSGLAQVISLSGTEQIGKGQVLTLVGATATQALASTLSPRLAGNIVDDHYRYRYPKVYDGRYLDYDTYLADPSYYDPYRVSQSYHYLPADIPGVYDLDHYGDWTNVDGYGYCWSPRVSADWAPFRHGRWEVDRVWGATWVSHEPWGWAPYHYGRWAFVNQRWFWVPVEVRRRPSYCPAPVAFISLAQTNHVAWVPLAPGEVFVPRYYDTDFQPHYVVSRAVVREVPLQRTFVNLSVPSAVTVVSVRSLTRVIDSDVIAHVDSHEIARHRPTLDPFAVEGVRQLAIRKGDARRRIKLARVEQEISNRRVVTTATPASLPQRINAGKAFRVEQVSEARKKDRLKIDQTGQVVNARRRDGLPQPIVGTNQTTRAANSIEREQQKAALAARANQGDKSARRELRRLRREERRAGRPQTKNNQQSPPSRQQNQQKQLHQQMKERQSQQRTADAVRQNAARPSQQEQMRQQQKERKRIERAQQQRQMNEQTRIQRARQNEARQKQQQQMRLQQKEPRRVERRKPAGQQPQRMEAMRSQQMTQQQERLKAENRAERHQRAMRQEQMKIPVIRAPQKPQTSEQPKAQRRIEQKQETRNQQRKGKPPNER